MRDEARAASSATARRGGDNNRIARIAAALAAARAARGELETLVLDRPFNRRLSLVIDPLEERGAGPTRWLMVRDAG